MTRTVEDVVSWVNLIELAHVFDWMATGGGGANAGLAVDASGSQSETGKCACSACTKEVV